MSLFQSLHGYPAQSTTGFTPFFRFLEDFDNYARTTPSSGSSSGRRARTPVFHARFDVRETDSAYELHGELAGMDKKDVHIEFTDAQTMQIRGRIERSYQSGTPPAGAIEGGSAPAPIAESAHKDKESHSHRATVQDEDEAAREEAGIVTETATDTAKYWVTERSVGEFSRVFTFPHRVDGDNVTASLNDGILHVVVPKAKKHETRRISVL